MAIYFLILAIVAFIVIMLGARTNLLKDIVAGNPNPPYSWSRTQLAFWTVIIFSSFLYLLFKYHFTVPELNNVNLILLGIAVTTTASAKLIDDSQKNNGTPANPLSQSYPSSGFLSDILSDKGGVSIHRLQNVLWTFAVGILYIQHVATQSGLPDETVLTNNLLILMGISTGAYVGIKTTENSK